MEAKDFAYLPSIEERNPVRRLEMIERANATLITLVGGEGNFDVYVAGVNREGMVVLSRSLNEANSTLISYPIAIEPQNIKSYKPIR